MQEYKEGLVSLILPVYNVEKYLATCVDVCLAQTYTNIEIILVDDGATDTCPFICDEYASKDNRVRVIHQVNGGLSEARNSGIKAAKGDWIIFIDPDDMINIRMTELLIKNAVGYNAPMAWCAIREIDEEGKIYNGINQRKDTSNIGVLTGHEAIDNCEITIYSKQEAEKQFYTMGGMQRALVAWNKIYHKSLFIDENGDKILYPKGKIFEDGFTTYRYIYQAEKIVFVNAPLYYYRQRAGSIMKKNSYVKFEPALEAGIERLDFYKARNEKELYLLELNYTIYSPIRFYEKVGEKSRRKELMVWFRRIYFDYFVKEKWPKAKKIRIWTFLKCYPLYKAISSFEGLYNRLKRAK